MNDNTELAQESILGIAATFGIKYHQAKAIIDSGFKIELEVNCGPDYNVGRNIFSSPPSMHIYTEVYKTNGMTSTRHPNKQYCTNEVLELVKRLDNA